MKKIALLIIPLILLQACSSGKTPESPAADTGVLDSQLVEKDRVIADLEDQVSQLTDELAILQGEYDILSASSAVSQEETSPYLCDEQIEDMKYANPTSAIAILEGWFALQPHVRLIQGTYSTQFWQDVYSRIHTIRYIDDDSGLSETETFLIFFEESDWHAGLLNMDDQCWLNYPK